MQLQNLGIHTSGVEVEESGVGVVLRLVDFLPLPNILKSTKSALEKDLLAATIRITVQVTDSLSCILCHIIIQDFSILG